MLILNMKLKNILAFDDFSINYTYERKLKNSLIDGEFLDDIPSFRYKKLNVFIGSNATGKTSLCKVMWQFCLFLKTKEKSRILSLVNKKYNEAYMEIDYVENNNGLAPKFNCMQIKYLKNKDDYDVKICRKEVTLSQGYTYEKAKKETDSMQCEYKDCLEALSNYGFNDGWRIQFPITEDNLIKFESDNLSSSGKKEYLDILEKVFKTLDSSITDVLPVKGVSNAYVIKWIDKEVILQSGMNSTTINLLSSGTKSAVSIANTIFAIKNHLNGIYFIDEQFSYINSDVEIAILSLITSLLGPDEQLFFTSHNSNILDTSFPFHSFYFLRKTNNHVEYLCGSQIENRNNVSLKNVYDNDAFGTTPNLELITSLGEIHNA